ncbi:MAG: 50S ribosomal protein L21 [Phycisphaerae bacterium]
MYAIFADGGKQYKVSEGDIVLVERKNMDGKSDINFDTVLMVGEGKSAKIGQPYLAGASVSGNVLEELKMPKIHGFKYRRRKSSAVRWGHRQKMLRVKITGING